MYVLASLRSPLTRFSRNFPQAALAILLTAAVAGCAPGGQNQAGSGKEAGAGTADSERAVAALGNRCANPGVVRPRGRSDADEPLYAVQCGGTSYLVTLKAGRSAEIVDCQLAAMQGRGCW